ncbi:MAG TPA: cytochrome c3 family protein [Pyrinomonadaceae bacterium]|nr:cytochrome c3 family protein [Pyrinomonadaceae bacterium]
MTRVLIRNLLSGVLTLVIALLFMPGFNADAFAANGSPEPQPRSQRPRPKKVLAPKKPRVDYSRFSHQTHAVTEKLACNSCHKVPAKNWKEVRKGDAAFPDVSDFPEHASCLTCHRQQFFARERPAPAICANCHVNNSPKDTSRWLFPSLGDVTDPTLKRRVFVSEFGVGFPHDKHIDVVGLNLPPFGNDRGWLVAASLQEKKKDGPPKNCLVCHETYQPQGNSSEEYVTSPPKAIGDAFWLKKGTFKTAPDSHAICFTCHSADSGIAPAPADCNVCHKLVSPEQTKVDFDPKLAVAMGITDQTMLSKWSRRISAGAFRHEGGEHPDLNCTGCHNAASAAFNTLDSKTLRVPVRSCGGADGCHVTATSDDGGALNFEIDQRKKDPAFVCTKCHLTFGKESIPPDHPQAIPTPKVKVKPS